MTEKENCNCPLCGGKFAPNNGLTADEYLGKGILATFKEMQKKETQGNDKGKPLPCPRCGYIRNNGNSYPLSRCEDVHICMNCAIEETVIKASGTDHLPITEWYAVSGFLKAFKG